MASDTLSFSVANILSINSGTPSTQKSALSGRPHCSTPSIESISIGLPERPNSTSCRHHSEDSVDNFDSSPLGSPVSEVSTPGLLVEDNTLAVHIEELDGTDFEKSAKQSNARRGRMRFTPEQIQVLERRFEEQHYLLPADRKILALALRMSERQVKTWFQNKRAQYKRTRPLIRNPIYHNFHLGAHTRQLPPLWAVGIHHLPVAELSAAAAPASSVPLAYSPTSPASFVHLQTAFPYYSHPRLSLATPNH